MKKVENIARQLGFIVNRSCDMEAEYRLVNRDGSDAHNLEGETLCVSVRIGEGVHPIWYVDSCVKEGNVWNAKYNPCQMYDGTRMVWNDRWKLPATPENFNRIMKEVKRRFFG